MKWILWYPQVTSDVGLSFDAHNVDAKLLVSYVDSNHGGDLEEVYLGVQFHIGGFVSWRSRKQKYMSQSFVEVEYAVATERLRRQFGCAKS